MADGRKDCIDEILEAVGKRLTKSEVMDHLEDIDSRAEDHQADGLTRAAALQKATDEILREQNIRSAIERRNFREDSIKFREARQFIDGQKRIARGIEALLSGLNTAMFDEKSRKGNQLSIGALALGAKKDWIGGVVTDLERMGHDDQKYAGLDRIFYSRAIEDDIFREKYQLDMGDRGKPGVTGNDHARKIAEVLHKWDKVRVEGLNAEGAWITNYQGYITRVIHDPDRIRKASNQSMWSLRKGFEDVDRDAWVAKTLEHLDIRRTFGGLDPEATLREMYGGFVDGSYMKERTNSDQSPYPSLARRVSANRELHWKSAEDWLAYNKEFGRHTPTEQWLNTMQQSAEHYALMKVLGSKPEETFNELMTYAQNKTMGTKERLELDKREQALRNRFGIVSGDLNRPVANSWAGIVNGIMAVQRLSKLGLTPFAMLQDNATISRELSRHGLDFLERNTSMLSGYFRGDEGSAKKEVADLLHTGILGRLRGVVARYDVSDARAGTISKLENTFFRITGITGMTENKRADAERMMAYAVGRNRGKDFSEIGASETQMLQAFGIGDKEWALLHKTGWNEIEGQTYLTPDVAKRIPDADIEAYLRDRGKVGDVHPSSQALQGESLIPAGAFDRARQDLALKLWAYYSERGNFAVLEPGVREKAVLYQGTQANTPLNLALRMLLQFKQFPATTISKAWGAEIRGAGGSMGKAAGIAELVVSSTLFGMLANYLNPLAKGQDPNAPWRNQPAQAVIAGFIRGGSGSIYGDFLLGEWSRFGLSATDSAVGPIFGQLNSVSELWTDLTHMKKGAATASLALRMARNNTPFANMIYTKAAVDYLIMYRMQEYLNPGYLQRMENTMKQKNGTEFLLRPSQVSR
jgi:hypothetical protein